MEIERINEYTVKFYISYVDIEERGFDREEIWYNREKSEELFWEMMEEIHLEDEFVPEGPLWIQVQALDKGLEVIVTKAQISKDGRRLELPIPDAKIDSIPLNENMADYLDQNFKLGAIEKIDDKLLEFMMEFNDLEHVISLAKVQNFEDVTTTLYSYDDKYHLYIKFLADNIDDDTIEDALSLLLEYGVDSPYTTFFLEEYGKVVMKDNVFSTINQYFN
ncbi:adaptor protein MecA [Lederbergia graminis]|uniref:Adapter protein MecA n=1 Tax=Lederbergia graminis TaxID=735518 RepID=A0ABW0LHM4_9BACI